MAFPCPLRPIWTGSGLYDGVVMGTKKGGRRKTARRAYTGRFGRIGYSRSELAKKERRRRRKRQARWPRIGNPWKSLFRMFD